MLLDRSMRADEEIFCGRLMRDEGLLSEERWRDYAAHVRALEADPKLRGLFRPDLTVFLDASEEVCLERIARRSRGVEASVYDADNVRRMLGAYRAMYRASPSVSESFLHIDASAHVDDMMRVLQARM